MRQTNVPVSALASVLARDRLPSIVLLFMLVAGSRAYSQQPPADTSATPGPNLGAQPAETRSWWFPSDLPLDTKFHYQMNLDAAITVGRRVEHVEERIDFVVATRPGPPDEGGCIVRMLPDELSAGRDADLTALWIRGLAESVPDGAHVTPDTLSVHRAPVLRGPWHAGDSFTVFGVGVWFLLIASDYVVGAAHFDVQSVSPTGAHLTFEFWAGRNEPALRGAGEVVFESDAAGIASVRASWTREFGSEKRTAKLTITRTRISKLRTRTSASRKSRTDPRRPP